MAAFNLTAEINLRGPSNIRQIANDIKKNLGNIESNVTLKLSSKASKNIDTITGSVNVLNDALLRAQSSANNLSSILSTIGTGVGNISKSFDSASSSALQLSSSTDTIKASVSQATSEMAEFGKQSALAVRRFAAFSIGTAAIYGLTRAFSNAFDEFIKFDRQMIRLQQTTGGFGQEIDNVSKEISRLASSLGVSSADLAEVSVTLAQAGLSANETKSALEALAKTALSPSFEDITQTTEGAIAAMRQFGIQSKDLESALSSINAVAASFAVESSDIISAIQRTGGVFASASRGVSEGKDALNEFIAVFTSVRATTRESAETIATGLRTIFTRIQRPKTIEALREFNIELTDSKGKFVGAYEGIKRISEGLSGLDTRDIRFAKITEELGGFRQIGKVIPIIQEFSVAQQALGVALSGQGSLAANASQAQDALSVQFTKTKESFLALVKSLGESQTFKTIISYGLTLTRTLIGVADAFKPMLPYLAILGGVKIASGLTEYAGGFIKNIGSKKIPKESAVSEDLLGSLFGSNKQKSRADGAVTDNLESLLSENNNALTAMTGALSSLEQTILSKLGTNPPGPALNRGGKVMAFAKGGYVPGSGNRDTVPAMLQPGEFVIRKKAVETLGASNLQRMNKYASGGKVKEELQNLNSDTIKGYFSLNQGIDPTDIASTNVKPVAIELNTSDFKKMVGIMRETEIKRLTDIQKFGKQKVLHMKSPSGEWAAGNAFQQLLIQEGIAKGVKSPTNFGTSQESLQDIEAEHYAPLDYTTGDAKFVQNISSIKNKSILAKRFKYQYSKNALNPKPSAGQNIFDLPDTSIYYPDEGLKTKFNDWLMKNASDWTGEAAVAYDQSNVGYYQAANSGGIIQRFMAGGVAEIAARGVAEIAAQQGKTTQEVLLEQIEALGKAGGVKKALGLPPGDRRLNSLLLPGNIKAGKNLDEAIKVVDQALTARGTANAAADEAIAQATKFGLVGLLPFDYSKQFGPENIGGRSTYIIARGVSSQYQDIVERMQAELSDIDVKYAEEFQMRKIFSNSQLVFDFDETLVDRSEDLMRLPDGSINIDGFNDLELVKKDLANTHLTPLGKELKKRLDSGSLSLDNIRIVTARPQSNAPFLAEALSRLGLNIPAEKITGVSGPENKINNVTELETLIDDRLATVQQFKKAGKSAISYANLATNLGGPAIAAGQAALEGATIEKILARMGAPLRPDAEPGRPIDYPDGLGIASEYFGIDPNMPTEVKRTIDGSSLSRTRNEIERFYNENAGRFQKGGEAEDILLKKYRDLLSSILPKEFLTTDGYLRTPGGTSESIDIIPPDPKKTSRSLMDILLGRQQKLSGAYYQGGLKYKILRQNFLDVKDTLPEKESETIKRFIDQNLLFQGEEDIIDLSEQKRRGSLAHESFHDIQGYLLDYFPEIYKQLQIGVEREKKAIEDWYTDPSTKKWRSNRDYQPKHLYPETYSDSPYRSTTHEIQGNIYKSTKERISDQSRILGEKTAMDMGRAEAIPVLLAASSEGDPLSTSILSRIFGGAGLNSEFYKSLPKFAVGGVATKKQEKEFGKIALRQDASSISATYFKNDKREGSASAYKLRDYLYYVGLSAATGGYGPRLYDVLMEAATANGAMLTSDRSSVSGDAKRVWEYYFKNRGDIKKTPLKPDDWTKNQSLIDPKLYGKPETWPPPTDPAWVLQTGYNKSPDLINDPASVINMSKQAKDTKSMALEYFGVRKGFANGGSTQDTVPALLTPGEFVINKKAAQRIGYSDLHKLNKADKLQGFNKGGVVGLQRFANGGSVSDKDIYQALKEASNNASISIQEFAQIIKNQAVAGASAAAYQGKTTDEIEKSAREWAVITRVLKGAGGDFKQSLENIVGQFDSQVVGEQLLGMVNKIIARANQNTQQSQPTTQQQTSTTQSNDSQIVQQKLELLSDAAGISIDKLAEKIKKFTIDTAIAYKTAIPTKQKTTKAAIALAESSPTQQNQAILVKEIKSLMEATGASEQAIKEATDAILEQINNNDQAQSVENIVSSNTALENIIRMDIDSNTALKYAIDETNKKFGTLTDQMTASATLLRGVESGRYGNKSLKDIERLQKVSEENPALEKMFGNQFPLFDVVNKQNEEYARITGNIIDKFGGFVGILGLGGAQVGNALSKIYSTMENVTPAAAGFANALSEAGSATVAVAKLSKEAGLDIRQQGMAMIGTAIVSGISGAISGSINQAIKNNTLAFSQASDSFQRVSEQLKLPGIQPDQISELRQQQLEDLSSMRESSSAFDENVRRDFWSRVQDLGDAVVQTIQVILSLKLLGLSNGGLVSYYSRGSEVGGFKPKGTDTVPAMLTPGEFVVNAKSAKKHKDTLEAINSNNYMSRGGVVYAAGGKWIKSDREAGRSSTGYVGTLSDFYNPFDEDFYKSSNDATEAVLKFTGRLSMVTAIVTGAAAAVGTLASGVGAAFPTFISFGTSIASFFTQTLPSIWASGSSSITSAFSSIWSGISSLAAGTWSTITAGASSAWTKIASIFSAGLGSGSGKLLKLAAVGTLLFNVGKSFFKGPGQEQQSRIQQKGQELQAVRQFSKDMLQRTPYADLKSVVVESRNIDKQPDRMRYFAERSPIIEQFQKAALLRSNFDIKFDQSINDFIQQQNAENQIKARIIAKEAQMEYLKDALLQDQIRKLQAAGLTKEESQTKAAAKLDPLVGVKTLSEALDKAATDADFAKLLQQALDVAGIEAQSQILQEVFGRLASKIQIANDSFVLSMTIFDDRINYANDSLRNLMDITIPNRQGNLMGGENPQFKIDRQSLIDLDRLSAINNEQIDRAVSTIGSQMGLGQPAINEFQQRFKGLRIIETELPSMLQEISEQLTGERTPGENAPTETELLTNKLGSKLQDILGKDNNMAEILTQEVISALTKDNRQQEGSSITRFMDNAPALESALKGMKDVTDGFLKTGSVAIDYGDKLIELGQKYSRSLNQVIQTQATNAKILFDTQVSLKEALGQKITLEEAFRPFEQYIRKLTGGGQEFSLETRQLIGYTSTSTTDPEEISDRLNKVSKAIETNLANQQISRARLSTENLGFEERRLELDNLNRLSDEFGNLVSEGDNLSLALKELASDTSRSSKALKEIQDQRGLLKTRQNNLVDFISGLNNPQNTMNLMKQVGSFGAIMGGAQMDPATLLRVIPEAREAMKIRSSNLSKVDADALEKEFGNKVREAMINAGFNAETINDVFNNFGFGDVNKGLDDAVSKFEDAEATRQAAQNALTQRMIEATGQWKTEVGNSGEKWNESVRDSGAILTGNIRDIQEKQKARTEAENQRLQELKELQISNTGQVDININGGNINIGKNGDAGVQPPGDNGTIRMNPSMDLAPRTVVGGSRGIEATNRSRGGMIYASDGQYINFQPKGTDTIPAMLTPGEFVVNARATKQNLGLLQSINNGGTGYNKGGVIYRDEGSNEPEQRLLKKISDNRYEIDPALAMAMAVPVPEHLRRSFSIDELKIPKYEFDPNEPIIPGGVSWAELGRQHQQAKIKQSRVDRQNADSWPPWGAVSWGKLAAGEKWYTDASSVGAKDEGPLAGIVRNKGEYIVGDYSIDDKSQNERILQKVGGNLSELSTNEQNQLYDDRYGSTFGNVNSDLYNSANNNYILDQVEGLRSLTTEQTQMAAFGISAAEATAGHIAGTQAATATAAFALNPATLAASWGFSALLPAIAYIAASALTREAIKYGEDAIGVGEGIRSIKQEAPSAAFAGGVLPSATQFAKGVSKHGLTEVTGRLARDSIRDRMIGAALSVSADAGVQVGKNALEMGFGQRKANLGELLDIETGPLVAAGISGFIFGSRDAEAFRQGRAAAIMLNRKAIAARNQQIVADNPGAVSLFSGRPLPTTEYEVALQAAELMLGRGDVNDQILTAMLGDQIDVSKALKSATIEYVDPKNPKNNWPETMLGDSPRLSARTRSGGNVKGASPGRGRIGEDPSRMDPWWKDILTGALKYGDIGPGMSNTERVEGVLTYLHRNLAKAAVEANVSDAAGIAAAKNRVRIIVSEMTPETLSILEREPRMFEGKPASESTIRQFNLNLSKAGLSEIPVGTSVEDAFNMYSDAAHQFKLQPASEILPVRRVNPEYILPMGESPPVPHRISGDQVVVSAEQPFAKATSLSLGNIKDYVEHTLRRSESAVISGHNATHTAIDAILPHNADKAEGHYRGGLIYASSGSLINFQPKGTDTVPAMLTPGEFVVNKKATQKNLPLLRSINNGYYENGGLVRYFQDGGLNGNPTSSGGVSIKIDSSSLDIAFGAFRDNVQNMKKIVDDFGKIGQSLSIGGDPGALIDASRALSTSAASIRNASDNFGNNITRLNETLSSLERSVKAIPSSILLQVSGGIPVNVNVTINDGQGLETYLEPFADTIYNNIANALSKSTNGNLNLEIKTMRGALI